MLSFGGRDRQAQESLLVFVQKILSSMLLLEIFLRGVEVGNKYSLGFLYLCKKKGCRANPAEIKAPKWDGSKARMTLKEIHKELWHLNEEMRRQRKSSHGRDPVVLALK